MRNKIVAVAGALATTFTAGAAWADDWIVTVGGRAQAVVPYEGAGHDIFVPTPSLSIRRAGQPERFRPADDGLGITVLGNRFISVGPVGRLRGKRDSKDDRVGLDEVKLAIEPGAFVTIWPVDWLRLHAEGRKGVRGHHGWVEDVSGDLVANVGPWTATIGPRAGWGDQSYMDTYFEVTPVEAAANPIIGAPYRPMAGLRYLGASGSLAYRWSPHWQVTANAGYHRLASQAADSPIVRDLGERDEFSGGIGLRYSFTYHH